MDFVSGESGGVIDLIIRITGGTRRDAVKWLAEFHGVELADHPLSTEQRAELIEERKRIERFLPDARYWRTAAVALAEETMNGLKAALFDPMLPQPDTGEIGRFESLLVHWRRLEGALLVAEYVSQSDQKPGWTAALVRAGRERECAQKQAILAYLRNMDQIEVDK
jgi:hypothetical protein